MVGKSAVGFLGCASIATALTGMILFAGPHTSASLNPAVSIAVIFLDTELLDNSNADDLFWKVYFFGPVMGAGVAGLFSLLHAACLEAQGPVIKHDSDEEAPLIRKEE